jgi:hypothetical protein
MYSMDFHGCLHPDRWIRLLIPCHFDENLNGFVGGLLE